MGHTPKISIVTPTFNQGQFIEQTIQSVLDQGYPDLEYMIIDGGSTDQTAEIIKKYEKHLSYWVSEKDKGQSDAINKGVKKCTGEIFNWINSDDYYEGNVFAKVAGAFSNPSVQMACGCSHIFGGDKEWVSEGTRLPETLGEGWKQPVIDQPATFFRMNIVREFNGLSENLHYTMDLEWLLKYWLRYGTNGMFKMNDVLVHFREHPGSKTVNFQSKFTQERIDLYRDMLSVAEGKDIAHTNAFKGIPVRVDYALLASTVNAYVYYELLDAYSKRNFRRFKELKTLLRPVYMNETDHRELKKMSARVKILSRMPSFLKRGK